MPVEVTVTPASLLELTEVTGSPKVRLTLPVPLRTGDRVRLAFRLKRLNGHRQEVLDVQGDFRVQTVGLSGEVQTLAVEAVGKVPVWKSVRREPAFQRVLPPARFPPTRP